tara:strand:- start:333 stop:743 length:411 start_codon:yes stop_codon:yes gene_type:complete
MTIDTSKLKTKKPEKKGMSDEDFAEALGQFFEDNPEMKNPKRDIIVKNMTPSQYKEYIKKFPDGQENVEINIIAETKAKGGLMRKAKGGLAEATARLRAQEFSAGGTVIKTKTVAIDKSPNSGLITQRGFGASRRT